MRALIQRVKRGSVTIDGTLHGEIGKGFVVLLGVKEGDTESEARYLAEKTAALRVFEDDQNKMNLSLKDIGGSALVVSQFTLYGDTRKGNRPGFTEAARPELAEQLYEKYVAFLRGHIGQSNVATGVFRAMMDVEIINDGPVTILLLSQSDPWFVSRRGNAVF